jgi:hypothetical protein
MARPKKKAAAKRTTKLVVLVTPSEAEYVRFLADEDGGVSAWVRFLIAREVAKAKRGEL